MKNFVAIESGKIKKGRYTFKIYENFDGKLGYIGESTISYGMTRGPESEVMNRLSDNNIIDIVYKGYYDEHQNKNFKIQYLTTNF